MIRNWWQRKVGSSDEGGNAELSVTHIAVDEIEPSPFQPRIHFNEVNLQELAESIEQVGLVEPIVVREVNKEGASYQLVVGERRLRACRMLGHETISAIVRSVSEREMALLALTENLQREDLHFIEEAMAFRRILDQFDLTQGELAEQLGLKQSTVSNKLRLLSLDDEIREAVREGGVGERHARALLRLPDQASQRVMLQRIIDEDLPVRQADELVEQLLGGEQTSGEKRQTVRGIIRDLRIFVNGLNQTVEAMRKSGLNVQMQQEDRGDHYEVLIRIAKEGMGAAEGRGGATVRGSQK
ncbi:MAG: ParB/RepB/Spo0J family partition protein [Bacillota bacterium]